MRRAPSLRELRTNAPTNVVILPTAAPRQVHQMWNKATRAERLVLREAHPWPGDHLRPGQRDAIRRAQTIRSVRQTPALRIVFALLAAMDVETRQKVTTRLAREARTGSSDATEALAIGECASLTVGESLDMEFAFKWLAERTE